ncbi:hypothetical protein EVAR_67485_1 [Eumeta japonica]|uniref:HTH psq-type domain-containing protein n=1 Tax=Eumeta variegata TaxID=151549 RepID=A0A4C1ZIS0_EUMVA|nr:hypothetical protein EVAR_67485_1 [Eumeta japonica]
MPSTPDNARCTADKLIDYCKGGKTKNKNKKRKSSRKLGTRNYRNYSAEMLELAVESVANKKISSIDAEKQFDIPQRKILNKIAKRHMHTVGAPIKLTTEEEQHFSVILAAGDFGSPLTKLDVRLLVFNYLKEMGVKKFLMNISSAKAEKAVDEMVNYFANLQETLKDVPTCNIVNYETNCSDNPGTLPPLDRGQHGLLTNPELLRILFTELKICMMRGYLVVPMMQDTTAQKAIDSSEYGIAESLLEYLKHTRTPNPMIKKRSKKINTEPGKSVSIKDINIVKENHSKSKSTTYRPVLQKKRNTTRNELNSVCFRSNENIDFGVDDDNMNDAENDFVENYLDENTEVLIKIKKLLMSKYNDIDLERSSFDNNELNDKDVNDQKINTNSKKGDICESKVMTKYNMNKHGCINKDPSGMEYMNIEENPLFLVEEFLDSNDVEIQENIIDFMDCIKKNIKEKTVDSETEVSGDISLRDSSDTEDFSLEEEE